MRWSNCSVVILAKTSLFWLPETWAVQYLNQLIKCPSHLAIKATTVSAKFIRLSDQQDKYVISLFFLISSGTEISDVASNTMYTQSQTDISSVLWNDSPNRTECPMKFHKVSRTLQPLAICACQTVHHKSALFVTDTEGWDATVPYLVPDTPR